MSNLSRRTYNTTSLIAGIIWLTQINVEAFSSGLLNRPKNQAYSKTRLCERPNELDNLKSIKGIRTNPFNGGKSDSLKSGFPLFSDISTSNYDDDDFASVNSDIYQNSQFSLPTNEVIGSIISSALLVTGTTVGAGTMVLPEMASAAGMTSSIGLFFGIYIINLLSGLLISEEAIQQHSDGVNSPDSFMALAEEISLPGGHSGGTLVAATSVAINWCILAFALMRAGDMLPSTSFLSDLPINIDPHFALPGLFAAALVALASTQNSRTLAKLASAAVTLLFVSFGPLLFSGLMNLQQDPLTLLQTPGTMENGLGAMAYAAPVMVSSMVYQNVVPTVTKLSNFNRFQANTALVVGSGIPMLMYIAWCFGALGGGIDAGDSLMSMMLLKLFSVASLGGSGLACVLSISGEFESLLGTKDTAEVAKSSSVKDDVSSLPSVVLAVLPPLIAGLMFADGDEFTAAIKFSGAYFTPMLYGILPVMLAWNRSQANKDVQVPGGIIGLFSLGTAALVLMGQELQSDISKLLADQSHEFVAFAGDLATSAFPS